MTQKLVLIDGSSLLSRNYYGSLPASVKFGKTPEDKKLGMKDIMQTKDGLPTNGLYSMMRFILKVIREQKPTHMAICWDLSRETFRKKIYPEYKGTRNETPPQLKMQFELAKKTLDYIGLTPYILEDFEADDIIGTLARKFEDDIATYIITGDQDALQLVNDNTKVWYMTSKAKDWYKERNIDVKNLNIPDKTFEYTNETVEENYGLTPTQIIDLKALEGDTSDNIPGVSGVGKTSAPWLIRKFGSVENLYKNIEGLSKEEEKKLKEELKEFGLKRPPFGHLLKESDSELVGKEAALLSKKLATIVTDIPEYKDIKLDNLIINLDENKMKKIFERLEFNSLF